MANLHTGIEWTDVTWNPTSGCTKVSQGCRSCYAERIAPRVFAGQTMPIDKHIGRKLVKCGKCGQERWMGIGPCGNCGMVPQARQREFTDVLCHPERLEQPLKWKKHKRIFVNSMSDLFHEDIPFEFIDQVFAVMMLARQHTFQVLTKRPARMQQYMNVVDRKTAIAHACRQEIGLEPFIGDWPPRNVWLGVSVENQDAADERIPLLLETPAAMRFLSIEPLLGPITLNSIAGGGGYRFNPLLLGPPFGNAEINARIDWVIVGGESGPKARPMNLEWARSIRDQCQATAIPFFMKQLSQADTKHYKDFTLFPTNLQVREFPESKAI